MPTNTQTSFCLPSKKRGGWGERPALDLHANEEPQEETSLPINGLGRPAAFVPTPACQHSLARRAPHLGSPAQGPRSTPRPTPNALTALGPYLRASYYPQASARRAGLLSKAHHRRPNLRKKAEPGGMQQTKQAQSTQPDQKQVCALLPRKGDAGAMHRDTPPPFQGQYRATLSLVY